MSKLLRPLGAVFIVLAAPVFGQQGSGAQSRARELKPLFTMSPLKNNRRFSREEIQRQSSTGSTIPLWSYSVDSPVDGKQYGGTMVGRSPFFNGHRTTVIPTYIVPVKITFADTGTLFDPTTIDSCLGDSVLNTTMQSPLFKNVDYVMNGANVGSTQYVDAFQRANFWKDVAKTPYHTLLGAKILSAINVTVPVANGSTAPNYFGCTYGTMDVNWWDNYVQSTLMPKLVADGVTPAVFPIFLFDSVFEYNGDPNQCCILGYHNAYTIKDILQTYAISSYDTSGSFGGDISVSSHEIAEWMDDPDTNNAAPAWGYVGQVEFGCQANLEVGDPLSPGGLTFTNPFLVTMPNGNVYTLQELAYFSWFFRQSPSIGSGGLYSNNGSFDSAQSFVCQ